MKLLLTGKNGQVGFELQRALAPLGDIVAVDQAKCDLLSSEAINPITTADHPTPAKRLANSRLDTSKFHETFGLELPHQQAGLDHVSADILSTMATRKGTNSAWRSA